MEQKYFTLKMAMFNVCSLADRGMQTHSQTHAHTHRERATDRQTNRQTDTHTERDKHTHTHTRRSLLIKSVEEARENNERKTLQVHSESSTGRARMEYPWVHKGHIVVP